MIITGFGRCLMSNVGLWRTLEFEHESQHTTHCPSVSKFNFVDSFAFGALRLDRRYAPSCKPLRQSEHPPDALQSVFKRSEEFDELHLDSERRTLALYLPSSSYH